VPLCHRRAPLAPIRCTPKQILPSVLAAMTACRIHRGPRLLTATLYHDPSRLYDTQIRFSGTTTYFLTRTLEKVKTEMSLQVLAYNMKRMINIFGIKPPIKAIAA
jgi:hypothetical protein